MFWGICGGFVMSQQLHNGVICQLAEATGRSVSFVITHIARKVRKNQERIDKTLPQQAIYWSYLTFEAEVTVLLKMFDRQITIPLGFLLEAKKELSKFQKHEERVNTRHQRLAA
jgi:hypothetical protein